jgi:hypothetical protein
MIDKTRGKEHDTDSEEEKNKTLSRECRVMTRQSERTRQKSTSHVPALELFSTTLVALMSRSVLLSYNKTLKNKKYIFNIYI